MILVVGATGILGSEVCRQLVPKGETVRRLARPTSDAAKVAALKGLGIETVAGNLRDPESLAAWHAALGLGGPEPISQAEVVRLFERAAGQPFEATHVPADALKAQYEAASDPMQQSFAGLMRCVASGDPIDMSETVKAIPARLTSVGECAERVLGAVPAHA